MHVASLSIFQSDLKQHIINHAAKDELYAQVKDKLQLKNSENKYEGYNLEEDGLTTFKNKIYIPSVADLRRIFMDEIHQAPYFRHLGYHKTIATARKKYFVVCTDACGQGLGGVLM